MAKSQNRETDTEVIVRALELLGGAAHLSGIYERVSELSPKRIAPHTIRGRLEQHSSDSNVWKNSTTLQPDLFVSFGIGTGWWGLRSYAQKLSESDTFDDITECDFEEGNLLLHVHMGKERSKNLVKKFKSALTDFKCRICSFNFEEKYGELGRGFIEAHHTVPVAKLRPGTKSKISDLIPVCSNCHRILHRNNLVEWQILKSRLKQI